MRVARSLPQQARPECWSSGRVGVGFEYSLKDMLDRLDWP